MTENEARAICSERGATFSIRQCKGIPYVYISRSLPHPTAKADPHHNSYQFGGYLCPLTQLAQICADTLKEHIAALPFNPNKCPPKLQTTPKPATVPPGPAFHELLATIPQERTNILSWAAAAALTLKMTREQISYHLAVYHDQLAAAGVKMTQSSRYRALFVPTLGTDSGSYFSYIWRDH